MRNDNNQAGYYNLIYDNGGYIISDDKTKSGWDDEKTIAAMQTLEGWIKDGVIPSLETMSAVSYTHLDAGDAVFGFSVEGAA